MNAYPPRAPRFFLVKEIEKTQNSEDYIQKCKFYKNSNFYNFLVHKYEFRK